MFISCFKFNYILMYTYATLTNELCCVAWNRPICRTLTDAVNVLDAIVGYDYKDRNTFLTVDVNSSLGLMGSRERDWE